MLIKSILNRIQLHKGFVYGATRLVEKAAHLLLEIDIRPRIGCQPICSGCGHPGPGYDTLKVRRFEFVPLWGIAVYFLYAMRRVDCSWCHKVKVERVPWADGKNHLTTTYAWFLAKWAKRMSWKEVADSFQTSWDNVFRSVKMAVTWGLAHRELDNITAIGIDEICWRKVGSKFLTLVYQIDNDCKRLLWVGKDRTKATLKSFFVEFGPVRSALLRFVFTDMWKPYLLVVAEMAGQALNVLDRFHIMSHMNKAIDKVRATEVRTLKAKGQKAVLTSSRWCLLKRPENCTEKQTIKLQELVALNLKTVRAYLLKEDFQRFWNYKSTGWAAQGDCMNEIFLTMVGYPICKTVSSLLERAFFDLFPPFFCPISHSSCLKGIANRGAVAQTPLVYLMNLTHAIALTWGQECKIATSGG